MSRSHRYRTSLATALTLFTLGLSSTGVVADYQVEWRISGLKPPANQADVPASPDCYDPANVGTIGAWAGCRDMLIVNWPMLDSATPVNGGADRQITHEGRAFTFGHSASNVFTGQVTDMSYLFQGSSFNADIGYWDTRRTTDMSFMFADNRAFNQPIGRWDTSSVQGTGMIRMFLNASAFNQPIGEWDVSNVTRTNKMFEGASAFNQPLASWDISNMDQLVWMFMNATSFNQPLDAWDTRKVTNMNQMFRNARAYNQDLSPWCVRQITSKPYLFDDGATSWSRPKPKWGVVCP